MKTEKVGCSQRVFNNYHEYPCARKGAVEENGRWWCKQHAPSNVQKQLVKQQRQYEASRLRGAVKCLEAGWKVVSPFVTGADAERVAAAVQAEVLRLRAEAEALEK